jgi:hypothetical protein
MTGDEASDINPALAQEIEDAVMFGKPEELKLLLDGAGEDGGLPPDVRQGLESLHYFRVHYGRDTALSDIEKKKITLMDSAWAIELLNSIRARAEKAAKSA